MSDDAQAQLQTEIIDAVTSGENPAAEAAAVSPEIQVLMEEVDKYVKSVEGQQSRLGPYEKALEAARKDLEAVKVSAQKATNADIKLVFEKAVVAATDLMTEAVASGQEVVEKIKSFQERLRSTLDQIKSKDPTNPLVQGM